MRTYVPSQPPPRELRVAQDEIEHRARDLTHRWYASVTSADGTPKRGSGGVRPSPVWAMKCWHCPCWPIWRSSTRSAAPACSGGQYSKGRSRRSSAPHSPFGWARSKHGGWSSTPAAISAPSRARPDTPVPGTTFIARSRLYAAASMISWPSSSNAPARAQTRRSRSPPRRRRSDEEPRLQPDDRFARVMKLGRAGARRRRSRLGERLIRASSRWSRVAARAGGRSGGRAGPRGAPGPRRSWARG